MLLFSFIWFFFVMLVIGVVVLIIFLILYLMKYLKFEKLDYHTFSLPKDKNPETLFDEVIKLINKLGYVGVKEDNRYVIKSSGVLSVNIELVKTGKPLIAYYVNVETWFVILLIILAVITLLWLAVIIGLIIYLKYDSIKRAIFSSITTTLAS